MRRISALEPYRQFILAQLCMVLVFAMAGAGCTKKKGKTTADKDPFTETKTGKTDSSDPKKPATTTSTETGDEGSSGEGGEGVVAGGEGTESGTAETGDLSEPERIKVLVNQAAKHAEKKTEAAYAEAFRLITDVLKLDFSNVDALMVMATIHYQQENMEKLRSVLEYVEGMHKKQNPPTEPGAGWHFMMGKYFVFQAKNAESKGMNIGAIGLKSQAEKYLSHSSLAGHGEAQFLLGVLLLERQEVNQAVTVLENAEKLAAKGALSREWRLPLNLGAGYMMQKKASQALTKLEYALNLNKNCEKCHYNLALLYISMEEYPQIGNLAEKARMEKAMFHARAVRDSLKKQKSPDRALQIRVESWMEQAKQRIDSLGKGSK